MDAVSPKDKPLVLMHGEVKTPPFCGPARLQAGFLLGLLLRGEMVAMPHSRPMPSLGKRCHELRIPDGRVSWRISYRIDTDAIVIVEVFSKKSGKTPKTVSETCEARLREYYRG
jgi:phage-related protein